MGSCNYLLFFSQGMGESIPAGAFITTDGERQTERSCRHSKTKGKKENLLYVRKIVLSKHILLYCITDLFM